MSPTWSGVCAVEMAGPYSFPSQCSIHHVDPIIGAASRDGRPEPVSDALATFVTGRLAALR